MREQAKPPRAAKANAVTPTEADATPTWFAYLVLQLSLAVGDPSFF